jgi:hypothetical protein
VTELRCLLTLPRSWQSRRRPLFTISPAAIEKTIGQLRVIMTRWTVDASRSAPNENNRPKADRQQEQTRFRKAAIAATLITGDVSRV